MSVAVISYRSLDNASDEAKTVARKLTQYADGLQSAVYRKLSNYSGDHTANIRTAENQVERKISALRDKSSAYERYASDLSDLRDRCESTDVAVRRKISQLTASFKSAHNIESNAVSEALNYFLTSAKNSGSAGRWISDQTFETDSIKDYIRQQQEDWWDYEGGKQLVIGRLQALCEIVMGVCGVVLAVAALLASGTVLAVLSAVTGLIASSIATMNGMVNWANEGRAYQETQNGDPAMGRRRSGEDTLQDTLRKETDSKFWHNVASGMDIALIVCTVVSLASGAADLIKNVYKWTSGSMAELKNLRVTDILKKGNLKDIGSNIGKSLSENTKKAMKLFSEGKYSDIGKNLLNFGEDLLSKMKNSYTNFDSLTDGASSLKNVAESVKSLTSGSLKEILANVTDMAAKNTELFKTTTYDGKNKGALSYNDDSVNLSDVTGVFDKTGKIFENGASDARPASDRGVAKRLTAAM